ncbi:hypothetical protein C8R42DRAFT_647550 [Lentinula raphanica]|nr:hypothetical protein C8R42DRAFT_647550 [Lentinula raphanica]
MPSSSKRRTYGKSGSSKRQRFAGGAETMADLLRSKLKTHSQTQITKLKAKQEVMLPIDSSSQGDGGDGSDDEMGGPVDIDGYDNRMEDVLEGRDILEHSHMGDFEDIAAGYFETDAGKKQRKDFRTRRDRTHRRNIRFAPQMESMTDAYMAWYAEFGHEGLSHGTPSELIGQCTSQTITAVDIFKTDPFWSYSLVRCGLWPCSPGLATVAVTTRTLELFRIQSLRCPRLSIQAFVKSLCDLQGIPFKPYLREQFSIAFDLYLDVNLRIHKRVMKALGRDSENWRLMNTCPCCMYRTEGEPKLRFSLLGTMDGNNSLKRLYRKDTVGEDSAEQSKERSDMRVGGGDYYLTREEVDEWSKAAIQEMVESGGEAEEANPCEERWKNLSETSTAKMWGVFEETGIFLCLCRHGFVLLIADMVRSGELAKYPLAIVNRLLDVFGKDLGIGYDIGCGFKATIKKSPLQPKAETLGYTSLVGAFHGHAHSRLCQTSHLATYIPGLGLEHLEQCESFFSESNELASSTRHMSTFHRRQAISRFSYHHDNFETYARLSKFLVDKYKQAIEIQQSASALAHTMNDLGITSTEVFPHWLKQEQEYLQSLKKEPPEETLQMEYFKKLEKYTAAQNKLNDANREWITYTPDSILNALGRNDQTRQIEARRRHAIENRDDLKAEVQALEVKLGIKTRWIPGSEEWRVAQDLVHKAKYRRALDKLEGLVVARLFELSKMNMSHTGYKLRKHIADSLKARSQAIRTAITVFNDAASELGRPTLSWEDVVEYSFLSDFDLLRDARRDVRGELWAQPAGRLAMDQYHKLVHAEEEIIRLNKEIHSLVTYIHEESAFLALKEEEMRPSNPLLAAQIQRYAWERARCNDLHMLRLRKLARVKGFTGSLSVGRGPLYSQIQGAQLQMHSEGVHDHATDEDAPPLDDDEDDEDDEDGVLNDMAAVIGVAIDK